MLSSMTGYAVASCSLAGGQLNFEVRSVNSRYLDINLRCDENYRVFESKIRQLIGNKITRGKIEIKIFFSNDNNQSKQLKTTTESISSCVEQVEKLFDLQVLEQIRSIQEYLKKIFPEAKPLTINEICQWKGVMLQSDIAPEQMANKLEQIANEALNQLLVTRKEEGKALSEFIANKLDLMRAQLELIKPHIAEANAIFESKIRRRLTDIFTSNEQERIAQEISIHAVKSDINEEIERINAHLSAVELTFTSTEACGKRLDFLMQELNREANTIASKAAALSITDRALELKLLIEQVREQIQNIE